jgi:hypothetical protein
MDSTIALNTVWVKSQWQGQRDWHSVFVEEYEKQLRWLQNDWYGAGKPEGLYYIPENSNLPLQDWQMLLPEQGGGLGLGRTGYGFPHGEVHSAAKNSIVLNATAEAAWLPFLYGDRGLGLEQSHRWLAYYRRIRWQAGQPVTSLHQLSEAGWVQGAIDRLSVDYPQEEFEDQSYWFLSGNVRWIPRGRLFRIIGYGEKVDAESGESLGKSIQQRWYWLD